MVVKLLPGLIRAAMLAFIMKLVSCCELVSRSVTVAAWQAVAGCFKVAGGCNIK